MICMVTGATSGLGAVTARELAHFGATVVVVGRNRRRCERQAERIRRRTGARVEALVADLSSQAQVCRLAEDFKRSFTRLDVLVNNAGSYFLLTNLLLERLEASPSARVVNVSSRAHEQATMDFDDLQCERRYERLEAYSRSKLANLLFTYELARRSRGGASPSMRSTPESWRPTSEATMAGCGRRRGISSAGT